MPLNAGDMDREITIQQLAESVGASRFPVETWTTLDTVWAERLDISGRERQVAGQLAAAFDCRWRIYFRDDMDPEAVDVPKTRRVFFGGRVLDITAATILGVQEGIELMTISSSKVA